jgi:hypothetical protein
MPPRPQAFEARLRAAGVANAQRRRGGDDSSGDEGDEGRPRRPDGAINGTIRRGLHDLPRGEDDESSDFDD